MRPRRGSARCRRRRVDRSRRDREEDPGRRVAAGRAKSRGVRRRRGSPACSRRAPRRDRRRARPSASRCPPDPAPLPRTAAYLRTRPSGSAAACGRSPRRSALSGGPDRRRCAATSMPASRRPTSALEGRPPFGRPVFILVGRRWQATLFFRARTACCERGAADIVEALVGVARPARPALPGQRLRFGRRPSRPADARSAGMVAVETAGRRSTCGRSTGGGGSSARRGALGYGVQLCGFVGGRPGHAAPAGGLDAGADLYACALGGRHQRAARAEVFEVDVPAAPSR